MENGKTFIFILGLITTLFACKRTPDDFVGPGIGYASKDFALTSGFSTDNDSINFKVATKLGFKATFNEKVSYTITIKGTQSGAVKHLKGYSDHIESTWTGNSELIFFKKEDCTAELSVLGKNELLGKLNITILGTYFPEGTLIANMEQSGITSGVGFWESYLDPVTKKTISEKIISKAVIDVLPALEGSYSWKSQGVDAKGGGFIGLSYTVPDNRNGIRYGASHYYYKTGTTNPDSLWFNIFIYGTGDVNAATYIKFMQDDNSDGSHSSTTENGFEQKILDLSHKGWKLFSFRYSDILIGGNTGFGGSGDNIHRPDKIVQVELALWSLQKGANATFIYDYPVFTIGKPFGQ